MKLKVLGSVSPYCQGKDNCPGYLITDGSDRVLLDCGNGVTRNMKFPNDLENLVVIISHLHRDHYGDLLTLSYASFVYHRLNLLKEKIKVYIPNDDSIDREYLEKMPESYLEFIHYDENSKLKIGNMNISFNKNPHPVKTYSIKVEKDRRKIVYSADTGYEDNSLITFCNNADLLICETTFLKDQKGEDDNHLNTIEAGLIAKKAKVKNLMVTHFWPEIPKRKYKLEVKKIFKNTIIAKNGKVLKIGGRY